MAIRWIWLVEKRNLEISAVFDRIGNENEKIFVKFRFQKMKNFPKGVAKCLVDFHSSTRMSTNNKAKERKKQNVAS